MILKSGLFLGLTLIALALSATFTSENALQTMSSWIISKFEEQNVSESDKVLSNIFRVNVKLSGSTPARINLDIEGEHPDGCEYPVIVGQSRRDNTVNIEVYREVPADVICPMILQPYRDTISVEGSFEPGEYTINVNSHSQALSI